jgi:hypothetical protein
MSIRGEAADVGSYFVQNIELLSKVGGIKKNCPWVLI